MFQKILFSSIESRIISLGIAVLHVLGVRVHLSNFRHDQHLLSTLNILDQVSIIYPRDAEIKAEFDIPLSALLDILYAQCQIKQCTKGCP